MTPPNPTPLPPRIADQVARLPPTLKQLLDSELAAGNSLIDVDIGRGPELGRIALILKKPFQGKKRLAPPGILYRELSVGDRRIFEFATADEQFSLVFARFPPMKLPKLTPGPPNPTEAHIARRKQQAKDEEEAALAQTRRAQRQKSLPRLAPASFGEAASKFLASMTMTFDMWHDGTGYDLDALTQIPPKERPAIEALLIRHQPRDWRNIEALAQFDTSTARQAVEAALKSSDPKVRREAMHHAGEKADPKDREKLLLKALKSSDLYGGLSEAIDEAEEFHPPSVIDALLHGALHRDGQAAIHFAALLFYIHGKSKEAFDWDHRPFFLRFGDDERPQRKTAFLELCQTIGVDSKKYLR